MQFIKTVFSSNSGRAIYEACKENSLLPEFIARKHGHVETANYLEEITTRYFPFVSHMTRHYLWLDEESFRDEESSCIFIIMNSNGNV